MEYKREDVPDNPTRRHFIKGLASTVMIGLPSTTTQVGDLIFNRPSKLELLQGHIAGSVQKLQENFELEPDDSAIIVSVRRQELYLINGEGGILKVYQISTSKFGVGNEFGSNKTPPGTHIIMEKVGEGVPYGESFRRRVPTGKIVKDNTDKKGDFITSRVLWLLGKERGINRGESIDSYERAIYIHGTPHIDELGEPSSNGCVRMSNTDVIELFSLVPRKTLVEIQT